MNAAAREAGARIESVAADAVAGGLVGVSVAARLPGGELVEASAGVRGLADPAPMTADTVFWIASCTKAITSVAVMQLIEKGRLALDEPVAAHLPALAQPKVLTGFDAAGAPMLRPAQTPITVRHLLTHTSGLGYDFCSEALTRYVAAAGAYSPPDAPLLFEPGTGWTYGISTDWAGHLVAAVSGEPFADYLQRRVFTPLGMTETGFAPRVDQQGRRAAMHGRAPDGALAPFPFEMPPAPHFGMGGGGLYSTAGDYLKFLDAILAGGGPILSPASVAAMQAREWEGEEVGVLPAVNPMLCAGFDPLPGRAKRWGLGFLINPELGPAGRSAGSLAWAGLGNCYYWADPATGAAGVFLAQHFPFGDPAALAAFAAFERAVYGA
jgi:CubicO group peptidase (beta-lactamase class C family)